MCFHNSTLAPRSERSSAKGRSTWKASGLKLEVDFTEKKPETCWKPRDIHCVYASIDLVPLCRAERPKPLATTPSSSSLTTSVGAWKSPRHTPEWWLGCGCEVRCAVKGKKWLTTSHRTPFYPSSCIQYHSICLTEPLMFGYVWCLIRGIQLLQAWSLIPTALR